MSRQRIKTPEYDATAVRPNGKRLQAARKAVNLSTQRVADYLGVTFAQVSAIERNKTRIMADDLRALSLLYRQPTDFFFLPDDP